MLTVGKAGRREGLGAMLERWPIARPHEPQPARCREELGFTLTAWAVTCLAMESRETVRSQEDGNMLGLWYLKQAKAISSGLKPRPKLDLNILTTSWLPTSLKEAPIYPSRANPKCPHYCDLSRVSNTILRYTCYCSVPSLGTGYMLLNAG